MTDWDVKCKTCDLPCTVTDNPSYGVQQGPQMFAVCPNGHRQGFNPRPARDDRLTQNW